MIPISGRTRATLTLLADQLQAAAGKRLVSLTVAGSPLGAEGPADNRLSVLIVLEEAPPDLLATIGPAVQTAAKSLSAVPFVITAADLAAATDIFPIRYRNMQTASEVLAGRNVLNDLEFDRQHLRLRCEQELSNVLQRLRNRFLAEHNRPKALAATLHRAARPFLIALSVAVELQTGLAPEDVDGAISSAVNALQLDRGALESVHRCAGNASFDSGQELHQRFADFVAVAESAVALVDQMDVSDVQESGS